MKEALGSNEEGVGLVSQLQEMSGVLARMKRQIGILTGDLDASGSAENVTINTVHSAIVDVLGEIRTTLSNQKGINLDSVYSSVSSQGETQSEIENMMVATEATVNAMQTILEKAQDRPFMTSWFENGSSGGGNSAGAKT